MTDPERTRVVDHRGRRIILFDFSGITDPAHGLAEVSKATAFMAAQPCDGSHFTCTDVTATRYDREIVEACKAFSAHNRPYVKASAVVSDSTIHRAAISMIALVTKRKLPVFETREAALDFLAAAER